MSSARSAGSPFYFRRNLPLPPSCGQRPAIRRRAWGCACRPTARLGPGGGIGTRAGRGSTLFVSRPTRHIWGIQVRGCVGIGFRLIQMSGDTISRPSRAARLATFKTARSREINVVGASDARCRPRSINF